MDVELAAALKAHRRRVELRMYAVPAIAAAGALFAPWAFDLNGTQQMILWVGALVTTATFQIECRLKTIQVRLAQMDDQIRYGEWRRDPDNHEKMLSEISDW
jgi:hypothetical protein